jgi:hypothetical protein
MTTYTRIIHNYHNRCYIAYTVEKASLNDIRFFGAVKMWIVVCLGYDAV